MLWILLLTAVSPHLVLDRGGAIALVRRWKPQVVAGHITSLTGTQAYARARIQLERKETMGAIYNGADLFIVRYDKERTVLRTVLWHSPEVCKASGFRGLRNWHALHAPHHVLCGDSLETDVGAWKRASRKDDI